MRMLTKSKRAVVIISAIGIATLSVAFVQPAQAVTTPTLGFFIGNGTSGNPTAGPALSTPFLGATAIAQDSQGNTFVADSSAREVIKVTAAGTASVFAGNGVGGAPTPGPATSSRVQFIAALAVDSSGNLYIADDGNNYIYKVTPAGTLSIFAGTGGNGALVAGPKLSTPLNAPSGLAVDKQDNVYAAVYGANEITKIAPDGTLSVIAGNGTLATPVPGPALSSPSSGSYGLAVDSAGNVYANEYDRCTTTKITPAGVLSFVAGNGTCGVTANGPVASTSLGYLYGAPAVDSQGNVFVADSSNHVVVKSSGGQISILGGTSGTSGPAVAGPVAATKFSAPYALTVTPDGTLLVLDRGNNRVETIAGVASPAATTSVTAALASKTATISWTAASGTGTTYRVTPYLNGVAQTVVSGLTTTSYTFPNLATGTYTFSVVAITANGESSATSSNSVVVASTATAPQAGIKLPLRVNADGSVTAVPVTNSPTPATQVTASNTTGNGSWTLVPDGGVFTAGTAGFFGSHGGSPMNAPAVGIAATSTNNGYLIAGADGGVFAYGDAAFRGSMGAAKLNKPVTNIASTCSGNGYFLVASDGGVFTFGDARFFGSAANLKLNADMVGIVDSCGQNGYWTFAKDGGVFSFGTAGFYGSLANNIPAGGVIGMVSAPDGKGYWLIGADRKAYGFGSVAR